MKRFVSAIMTAGLLAAGSASATLIVDLNPPAITVNSRAAETSTTTERTWNFSDTTVLINSGGGSNDKVYGGMTTGWSAASESATSVVRWLNTSVFQVQVLQGTANTFAKGIVLWNQADFLNGADSQTVGFSAGDSLSVNFAAIGATTRDFRFVVNQGGTYYVSNVNKTDATAGVFSIDPAAVSWRTISTDGNYTIGGTASMITLDDVKAVGLYINASRTGNQTNIQFNDFQASVIPEPATIGMLGLGGLVALMLRRCRK